jgi:hypothetical protein
MFGNIPGPTVNDKRNVAHTESIWWRQLTRPALHIKSNSRTFPAFQRKGGVDARSIKCREASLFHCRGGL